ncbi:MAG: AmmeMemoRadiSam system radical SAM enzyme [Halanaerobium sp.]|nr:AmmeMemoRadiSam system radical SAM enzyme [Halanaerobium sp.]
MARTSFYHIEDGVVECNLCPHHCTLAEGQTGICLGRKNESGRLVLENYGQVTSLAMDPIEKKPLFHFHPGKLILSLGTFGCNLRCSFCQNWTIAQKRASSKKFQPEDIIELARDRSSIGIAYTYNEPLIWYEFVYETARLTREAGLKNVLVTNGFIEPEPLKRLLAHIDAANLDLKAFSSEFYRDFCRGDIEIVKRNAVIFKENCHLELATLLIPDENDGPEEIASLASWASQELGPETPLHLTRYYPNYRLELSPTPLESLDRARKTAEKYLYYVYLGNAPGGANTACYECGYPVIERSRAGVKLDLVNGHHCPQCGAMLHLVD